ncbi:dnaJsubfamily C member 30-like [Tropilaelaps mercedesae]|uniref:DnaJsubfamily C member 30-like n=1 Tax=Tropilaelaps mercedesae TaxID=418985 RepID=A0A1V9XL14_9ACAR|nr:dnaJsubfamily C member 30-like [Tropilaelaps mercedesae]
MLRELCRCSSRISKQSNAGRVLILISTISTTAARRIFNEQRAALQERCGQWFTQSRLESRKIKSYYDILEVPENCSANEIKSAFYRLSMKFHPDRNANRPEAVESFRTVSEAYQVLSNQQSREQYDTNVLGLRNAQNKSNINVQHRPRRPPPTGRSHIYNFDEFYRQHYGPTLERDQKLKQQYQNYKERRDRLPEINTAILWLVCGLIWCVYGTVHVVHKSDNKADKK